MFSIFALTNWQWWAYLIWFGVAIFFSWILPGLVVTSFTSLPKKLHLYGGLVLGLCLWAVQGYFLGWLHLRWLTFGYLALMAGLAWYRRKQIFPLEWKLPLSKWILGILIFGSVLQLTPVFTSGLRSDDGIAYYFVNIFDGVFHLSLARATVEQIPPEQPGAVGLPVTNYHYVSNLTIGELGRVWGLPLNHLYFQYVPLLLSVWFGFIILLLIRRWTKSDFSVIVALWLFYLVGELSWLFTILLNTESRVPFEVFVDHGVLQFLNPPQAFAKIVFLSSLLFLAEWWRKKSWLVAGLIGMMLATLFGFKVYFGLLAGLGLVAAFGVVSVKELLKIQSNRFKLALSERWLQLALVGLVAAFIGASIYLPANHQAGGLFFDFLTWPKLLLGAEKINWNEWWLRLQVYQAHHNTKALVVWYSLAAGIFLMSIFHLRLLGLLAFFPRWREKLKIEELAYLAVPAVACIVIGMNFLQTSGGYNTFNFFIVALVPLNLLTAVSLGSLQKRWAQAIVIGLLVCTSIQTVPLQYHFIHNVIIRRDRQVISPQHEAALDFISTQPTGTVLQTLPRHYLDETTPYLYFFTGHQSYLGGKGILESHNQPIADRRLVVEELFGTDATTSAQIAHEVGIDQVVLLPKELSNELFYARIRPYATMSAVPHWEEVFNNGEVILLTPRLPVSQE